MRKFLLTAVASLLLATPVLAQTVSNLQYGSDEPQSQVQWDALVAKANADRVGLKAPAPALAQGDIAAVKGNTATDAASAAAKSAPQSRAFPTYYHSTLEILQDK
jgi:hypothetical protein